MIANELYKEEPEQHLSENALHTPSKGERELARGGVCRGPRGSGAPNSPWDTVSAPHIARWPRDGPRASASWSASAPSGASIGADANVRVESLGAILLFLPPSPFPPFSSKTMSVPGLSTSRVCCGPPRNKLRSHRDL